MTKEDMLKRAFSQAMSNAAIRHQDSSIDFVIMKNDMVEYCAKKEYDLTEDEIVSYIREEMQRIREAMIDFSYDYKMMP